MKRFIFTPTSQPKHCTDPAEAQWCIIIEQKYTEREAGIIRAFISGLLKIPSREVADEEG